MLDDGLQQLDFLLIRLARFKPSHFVLLLGLYSVWPTLAVRALTFFVGDLLLYHTKPQRHTTHNRPNRRGREASVRYSRGQHLCWWPVITIQFSNQSKHEGEQENLTESWLYNPRSHGETITVCCAVSTCTVPAISTVRNDFR